VDSVDVLVVDLAGTQDWDKFLLRICKALTSENEPAGEAQTVSLNDKALWIRRQMFREIA